MANEFKHKSVGTELTQTEFEAVGGHVFDSQARGDIPYATSTTQLSRLAVGGAGAVLTSDGTDPAWDTTWSPTGHLIPASDDSYDLGSASAAWQDLFLEGDITLTDAGTLATSAGALTVTSAAAATWSTSAGALTLNGTGGVNLQEGGSTIISISDARALATTNTASVDLDATGAIQVNSSGGALSIGNDNVDQTINIATAGTRTLNIGIGDGTDITTTVVKGTLSVGVDDTGYDVKLFGDTASRYWLWDTSADGVVQRGTLTVGVDDAGHDVIFYGDAASANMTWDASVDDLILNGAARIVVPDGQLVLGSTAVGSTAGELNLLDGSAKSTSSITLADADAFIVIDGTTTKQIPASDLATYITAEGAMNSFQLEDDSGDEVTINNANEIKFIGSGITTNWTDTDNGTDGDPYDMTFTVDAAQTGITSLLATDIKIGEDDQTKIDFETADEIHFFAANVEQVYLADNIFGPQSDSDVDLGTTGVRWKDAFVDSLTVTDDVTVAGNLTVTGTTTTVNTVTMNAANAVVFEGATADAYETTLTIEDPTADRTVVIPNVGGTLAVLAADSDTAITATPAELNLVDGGTARGTTSVASGDGILINDGGTMRMTNVDTVSTYFSSHNVGGGNIVTTGALDSGSITSGFTSIDVGSGGITTTGAIAGGTIDASTDFTIGDTVITDGVITDTSGISIAANVSLADDKVINLGEAGKIDFGDEAPADNAATGIVFSFIAGATLAIGDVVYMHTDGEVAKADADAVTSMPAIGICVGAGTDGNAVDVLVQGIMHDTSAFDTFTVGADIFVSTTAGAVTATAPSGSGDTVQKVGVALHADMVYFNFNTTEVLLA